MPSSRRLQTDFDRAPMPLEPFCAGERHRRRTQRRERRRVELEDRRPLHEIQDAEAGRKPRAARRWQHVVRTRHVVADRFRRRSAEKDRAGVADFRSERFRINGRDFEMLGGDAVG